MVKFSQDTSHGLAWLTIMVPGSAAGKYLSIIHNIREVTDLESFTPVVIRDKYPQALVPQHHR